MAFTPMRLFVALTPPAAVLDELEAATAPLRAQWRDLRWTSRDAWHVTLAFLGEVDEAAVTPLLPRLERAAGRHPRLGLALAGAGAFPQAARARVLWSGLDGDRHELSALAAAHHAGPLPRERRRPSHRRSAG